VRAVLSGFFLSRSVRVAASAPRLFSLTILLSLIAPPTKIAANTPSACVANFESGGSVLRGTTYWSFEEYPGVRKRTATEALTQSLTKESFVIVSSDDASGSLTAAGSIGGREAQNSNFHCGINSGWRAAIVSASAGGGEKGSTIGASGLVGDVVFGGVILRRWVTNGVRRDDALFAIDDCVTTERAHGLTATAETHLGRVVHWGMRFVRLL
jgi:hypothetical protein